MDSTLQKGTDRYQIIEKIGAGGMGTVFRARDKEIERDVALKLLPPYFSADTAFVERFKREARVIARLEHPHIVPIYDVGDQDGRPFIIMRLLTGGTLRDRIRRPEFDLQALVTALDDVADALARAHAENIVHRDIKPGNILFDDHGAAFLSDFGIAKVLDAATQLTGSGLIGTPAYMSPEQFVGQGIDGRSDQYSLAVVVYEALTGKLPFKGNTAQMMYKHLNVAPPEINLEEYPIPIDLNPVLQKAFSKDPNARYPTIKGFVAALRAGVNSDPGAAAAHLPLVTTAAVLSTPQKPPTAPTELDTPTPPVMTQLRTHYREGLNAMSHSEWAAAIAAFDQILAVDINYGEAQTLRQQAKENLDKETSAAVAAAAAAAAVMAKTSVEVPSAALMDLDRTSIEVPSEYAAVAPAMAVAEPVSSAPPPAQTTQKRPLWLIALGAFLLLALCAAGAFAASQYFGASGDSGADQIVQESDPRGSAQGEVIVFETETETAEPPTATPAPTEEPEESAVVEVQPATNTPQPSATAASTSTPLPPTETAMPAAAAVRVKVASANLRRGPGVIYGTLGAIFQGETATVIGTNQDGSWYNVILEDGSRAWLAASVTEAVDGASLSEVPVAATIPVAPTSTPVPPTLTPLPTLPPTLPPAGGGSGGGGGGGGSDGGSKPPATYTAEPPG